MKRQKLIALLAAMTVLAGCGSQPAADTANSETATEASTAVEETTETETAAEETTETETAAEETTETDTTAEDTSEETETDTEGDSSASTANIPAYEYPGPEAFYSVVYDYVVNELSEGYEPGDVAIPNIVILAEDDSDKEDIKVYGQFYISQYKLEGEDTLVEVSGGENPGCMHLKFTDDAAGYAVTEFETVADGENYADKLKEILGDHYADFEAITPEMLEENQLQIISNYVAANNLAITKVKGSGWGPKDLPEENIDSFYSQLD